MNRSEYLEGLTQALSFMSEDNRAAAVTFYAEMLDDRIEEGKTEPEAVANMESIDAIAARLRAEYGAQETHAQPQSAEPQKSDEPVVKTIRAAAENVKCVVVAASNTGVRVEHSADGDVSIEYYTDEFTKYEASFENGCLKLRRLDTLTFEGAQIFKAFNLFISRPRNNPDIIVRAPQDSLIDLDILSSNAKISLSALRGLGSVRFKSSNGSLVCDTVSMLSMDFKTSNGKIELSDVQVKRNVEARTSNAHFEARSLFGGEDVTLATTNGGLRATVVKANGDLSLTSSNGRIDIEKILARSYRLRTSNASITGTLPGAQTDYRIASGTSNGKNSLPPHQAGEISLEAFTSNAAIRVGFEG